MNNPSISPVSSVSLHALINTLNAGLTHMEQEIQISSTQKKSATQVDRFTDAMAVMNASAYVCVF
jgi:hypothetical protein